MIFRTPALQTSCTDELPNRHRFLVHALLATFLVGGCLLAAQPADPNGAPPARQTAKILIITGIDYPGHKWQETAPALAKGLRQDRRLRVTTVEKPEALASDEIFSYDALVIHFMNWETPDPGPQARENLMKFAQQGGGIVLTHFACGAFQEWPDFVKVVGRVWDPKLRGHDPYGPFQVDIADANHPITRGLQPFEITDELYTCLTGRTPIKVLATATSKVDQKVYPMAFVLNCGKGRVFHCVLGHDAQAFANPGAAELFRRGTAWTAQLPPKR